ncbi:hypothetical protein ERO13_D05G094500v2 [Gossypium hirsutum]|uniref:Cyclin-dependent protein kinase inhibitor SMR4 n=1 Tax=Gossypium hirsutum TaxID=3635 RepID=A0A1U8J984_GOSHI|nr:cyclin-dependent protein kinase inhibitor SMR4 [Gossypium hirsutum]KAG4145393.1 hypothetical protein ERO13_D05G094500v2 [Gossypium hirsutum]
MEDEMVSYEDVVTSMIQEGWSTPTRGECWIPAVQACPPPPPKKKPFTFGKKRPEPPKNGYFQPPDLEMIFSMGTRRQAWA